MSKQVLPSRGELNQQFRANQQVENKDEAAPAESKMPIKHEFLAERGQSLMFYPYVDSDAGLPRGRYGEMVSPNDAQACGL